MMQGDNGLSSIDVNGELSMVDNEEQAGSLCYALTIDTLLPLRASRQNLLVGRNGSVLHLSYKVLLCQSTFSEDRAGPPYHNIREICSFKSPVSI